MVARNRWSLDGADLASDPMTPVHHLVKNFLLGWVSIGLVLFADWHAAVAGVVPHAEEVGSGVVAVVGFGLIRLILVLSCHDARVSRLRIQRMYAFQTEARWLRRLPRHRTGHVLFTNHCLIPSKVSVF